MDTFRQEQAAILKDAVSSNVKAPLEVFKYITDIAIATEAAKPLLAIIATMRDILHEDGKALDAPGDFMAETLRRVFIDPQYACLYGMDIPQQSPEHIESFVSGVLAQFEE